MSAVLFALYVNDVIRKLEHSKLGCCVGDTYTGRWWYSIDCSFTNYCMLQKMIGIVVDEARNIDMTFNASKSAVIRIGKN